jgi:hypothetical protein
MEAQLYMSENDSALQYAPARPRFYYGSLKFNWALGGICPPCMLAQG